jgi:hypothetical protein
METCTVTQNVEIVPGTRADYESLSSYHYREHNLGPYAAIYALKGKFRTAERLETVGVIVYAMPAAGCQMRSNAIEFLSGLDRCTRLKLINVNIRTISRVIIEPRFRSLGLASRLVSETMPLMNVPFIEALAVMGEVNPFFEKAGMTRSDSGVPLGRIDAPVSVSAERPEKSERFPGLSPGNSEGISQGFAESSLRVLRLIEAFAAVGIDKPALINPQLVQQKLDSEASPESPQGAASNDFIEREMTRFLQSYGQRRLMPPCLERTKFILSKLTDRPVYYFWKNPNVEAQLESPQGVEFRL